SGRAGGRTCTTWSSAARCLASASAWRNARRPGREPSRPTITRLRSVACIRAVEGVQGEGGVRVGAASAHLRCHPDRLHDLLWAGAGTAGELGMALDAVRALRHVGYCHRDQLLGLLRQRPVGEHRAAEVLERLMDLRSQLLALG